MTAQYRLLLAALCAAALAGCNRHEEAQAPAAAPAASAASTAAAPAPAPAPAGPVIAPVAAVQPTDAQRGAGATIAAQGGGGAVAACNSCHGAHGEGNPGGGFPRIAGQSYAYLAHELESYASGTRKHPVMQPIAAAMTPDQRNAAAAYFASLNPDGSASASAAAGAASGATATAAPASATRSAGASGAGATGRGAQLANVGDNGKGIQACANCHGPGGVGSGELYPYLAGQHANYLTATLGAWRDGSRANDPSGQMPLIAQGLTQQDVAAVAAYYAAQPPRTTAVDAEHMAAIGPAAAASGPAVVSGPQAQAAGGEGASPAAGTGTESGAPVSGGAQGAGGGGGTGPASNGAPQQGASAPR